jgi:hypothetical protein
MWGHLSSSKLEFRKTQIKISKQVCGVGEFKCEYINGGSENVKREYKKSQLKRVLGLCELMHHKTWFGSQIN